jgi:hypothetical protein
MTCASLQHEMALLAPRDSVPAHLPLSCTYPRRAYVLIDCLHHATHAAHREDRQRLSLRNVEGRCGKSSLARTRGPVGALCVPSRDRARRIVLACSGRIGRDPNVGFWRETRGCGMVLMREKGIVLTHVGMQTIGIGKFNSPIMPTYILPSRSSTTLIQSDTSTSYI